MTEGPPDDGRDRATEGWRWAARRLRDALRSRMNGGTRSPSVGRRLQHRIRIGFLAAVGIALTFGVFGDAGVDHIGAYVACQELIADQLSAPATAEYPPHNEATFTPRGDGWEITSTVTAMDTAGGQLSVPWTCTMDLAEDGTWIGEVALQNR